MKQLPLLLVLVFSGINSCKVNPVDSGKPQRPRPVISSSSVLRIGNSQWDSAILLCNLIEPPGNTSGYEGNSGGGLRTMGIREATHCLKPVYENTNVSHVVGMKVSVDTPSNSLLRKVRQRKVSD